MKREYIGTKRITAWEEGRKADEEGVVQSGYHVIYSEGERDEYHSWSPKHIFEDAYQPLDAMSFSHALECVKAGQEVSRPGWGCGVSIFRSPDSPVCIDIHAANGQVAAWFPLQADMFANDWRVIGGSGE